MNKQIAILALILVAHASFATNYYVDASGGNDLNSGISENMAWKTISKVVSMVSGFQPGDSILFKKGEIWNGEQLKSTNHPSGTIESPITYGSYGTGAKPILNIHIEQSPSWTSHGNNIWSAEIGTGSRFFKNGIEMLRAVDLSYLGLYGTEYYTELSDDGNNFELYVFSTVNPAMNTYSWDSSSSVVELAGADYIHFAGLEFRGGANACVNILNNIGWEMTNCGIGFNAAYGCVIENSSNIVINDCIFDSNLSVDQSSLPDDISDVFFTGCEDGIFVKRGSSNLTFSNCFFKNWGHASFNANTADSLNIIQNITFYNNELTSPDILYGGRIGYSGYSNDGQYYNNYIHDISVANQLGGSHNHFHHNIIDGVMDSPLKPDKVGIGIWMQNYNVQIQDNIIEHNVIANTESKGFEIYQINWDYPNEFTGNVFRNNIIYNCGTTENNIAIQFHKDYDEQLIYNNIVENNLIYSSNTTQTCLYQYNGTLSDVAIFNEQDTDIIDNLAGNPFFVDPANGDYHLTENSMAIDAGATPLATEDYDGNPIPSDAADIGAFEYQVSLAVENLLPLQATVTGKAVLLNWISNKKENNDYFLIERSQNAIDWESIGRVNDIGINQIERKYKFFDSDAPSGRLYYRLKQVDFDGRISYSNTVSVFLNIADFQIYPNPSGGFIKILDSGNHKIRDISLLDLTGQKVLWFIPVNERIDLSFLEKGLYFLRFETVNKIIIKKIILLD